MSGSRTPVCGVDFCDDCGECLACYAEYGCYKNEDDEYGSHVRLEEEERQVLFQKALMKVVCEDIRTDDTVIIKRSIKEV